MASYPKQVPRGWTRGQSVITIGDPGPRFAVVRVQVVFEVTKEGTLIADDSELLVEFDSLQEARDWMKWWYLNDDIHHKPGPRVQSCETCKFIAAELDKHPAYSSRRCSACGCILIKGTNLS